VALTVQCRRADDQMIGFATTVQRPGQFAGTHDWTPLGVQFTAPEGTVKFVVFALLSGTGQVWFDDLQLVAVPK
jgi:S1-C subfamily serine protease